MLCNGHPALWVEGTALDKFLDLLEIVIQGVDNGTEFLQEVLGAMKGDSKVSGREIDARRQISKPRANQGFRLLIARHLLMLAAGVSDHPIQVAFQAVSPLDFGAEAAVCLELAQMLEQFLPPADQGATGAAL